MIDRSPLLASRFRWWPKGRRARLIGAPGAHFAIFGQRLLHIIEIETEAEHAQSAIARDFVAVGRDARHPHRGMRLLDRLGDHAARRHFHQLAVVLDRVAEIAKARGVPRAQVALAWLLAKPVITAPIVGATKLQQLDDALASVNVKLSPDEITSLEELYIPHAVVGFV